MENGKNPNRNQSTQGVTWLLRGVTWCALIVMLAASGLHSVPSGGVTDTDSGAKLLASQWEDASTLETSDTLTSGTSTTTVDPEVALVEELSGEVPVDDTGAVVAELDGAALVDSSGEVIAELDGDALVDASGTEIAQLDGATLLDSADGAVLMDSSGTTLVGSSDGALLVDAEGAVLVDSSEYVDPVDTVVQDNVIASEGWIADLNGWVPNLGTAIGFNKPSLSGAGIDIALIDSGITPVVGLDGPNKVVNGPDLSADADDAGLTHLDLYGHGTHMAGIIAGNDAGNTPFGSPVFKGIAPGARLVNLKVADGYGNTSPEQVVAAIEWAILHRNDNGMNIRVLALALGHDETNYMLDPLAAALEAAWDAGIVVVVAGGNDGITSGGLDAPAIDPYVISVAGSDQADPLTFQDDAVASWSSSGDNVRNPEVLVPGKSIISLRVPGSWADVHYPQSAVGTRFAVASGTSQATAVLSGAVALMLEEDPSLTPDQVKHIVTYGAKSVEPGEDRDGQGRVRLFASLKLLNWGRIGPAVQQFHPKAPVPPGFGTVDGGWSGNGTWTGATWSGATWSGATWSGATWSGVTWSGATWSGATWSGVTWSGATWSGATWSGATWSGATWS